MSQRIALEDRRGQLLQFVGDELSRIETYGSTVRLCTECEIRTPDDFCPDCGFVTDEGRRWSELVIYRTQGGRYVVHFIGHSTVPGEVTRYTVRQATSADELVRVLQIKGDLPNHSRVLLVEAGLEDALVD